MRFLAIIPVFVSLIVLSSCILGGGTKKPKTPVVPAVDNSAAAKPAPPSSPLSSPQTNIQLPPEQAISPEALATIQQPQPPPPEPPAPPKAAPPKKPVVASAPKPEPPLAETPAPVQTVPVPAAPSEEQPRLQAVYTEEEKRRILGELEKRKNETEGLLRGLNPNRMSAEHRSIVERIRSFMSVAEDQAKRGDFRSADALSERALILARELASGR